MAREAMILNREDNVATAVRQMESGERIRIDTKTDDICITVLQAIHPGHKLALRDIQPGEHIIKYGEVIGRATAKINQGEHVHVHNVEGLRGRGDR